MKKRQKQQRRKRGYQKRKYPIYFLILIAIFLIDRLTKTFFQDSCFGFICIKKAINMGAAFGILKGYTSLFIIVAILVLVAIQLILIYKKISLKTKLALTLIAAGTLSNLLDRVLYNHVIDVFSILNSPSFNIADLSNVVGAIMLLSVLLKKK